VWGSSSPETGLMLTSDQARFHCSLIALNARPVPLLLLLLLLLKIQNWSKPGVA